MRLGLIGLGLLKAVLQVCCDWLSDHIGVKLGEYLQGRQGSGQFRYMIDGFG